MGREKTAMTGHTISEAMAIEEDMVDRHRRGDPRNKDRQEIDRAQKWSALYIDEMHSSMTPDVAHPSIWHSSRIQKKREPASADRGR